MQAPRGNVQSLRAKWGPLFRSHFQAKAVPRASCPHLLNLLQTVVPVPLSQPACPARPPGSRCWRGRRAGEQDLSPAAHQHQHTHTSKLLAQDVTKASDAVLRRFGSPSPHLPPRPWANPDSEPRAEAAQSGGSRQVKGQ
uniref:Uncharacterized protein n=1 Tax=Colobus angolensis palliatus TaxID=336983 RepID=A0A2K5JL31_COLAP